MNLLVKPHPPAGDGTLLDVTPESAGWGHVGFRAVRLVAGQTHAGGEPGREACLVLLSGTAAVCAGALHCAGIGGRAGVFVDAPPAAVYVPYRKSTSLNSSHQCASRMPSSACKQ